MSDRLFVAIWLPASVRDELTRELQPLTSQYPQIHWQPPERWHLTLAFLGDRDIDRELSRFTALPSPLSAPIRLAGGGKFGTVLWAGVESQAWLGHLALTVQRKHRCSERRFTPHVTLGRSRTPAGSREVARAKDVLASFASDWWTPAETALVRSTTGPRPTFEVMARSPLTVVKR